MGCFSSAEAAPQLEPPVAPMRALDGRPTRQLTAAPVWRADGRLTAQAINRMRQEFWETRVEGDAQTWAALRVVADTVLQGEIAQANALLEVRGAAASETAAAQPASHRHRPRQPAFQRRMARFSSASTGWAALTPCPTTACRTRRTWTTARRPTPRYPGPAALQMTLA